MHSVRLFIVLGSLLSVLFQGSQAQADIIDLGDGRGTIETNINGQTGSVNDVLNVKVHNIEAYTSTVEGFTVDIRPEPRPNDPFRFTGSVNVYYLLNANGMQYKPSLSIPYDQPSFDLTMTEAVESRRPPNGPPTFGWHGDVDIDLLSGSFTEVSSRVISNPPPGATATQVDIRVTFAGTSEDITEAFHQAYGASQVPEPSSAMLLGISFAAIGILRRPRPQNR